MLSDSGARKPILGMIGVPQAPGSFSISEKCLGLGLPIDNEIDFEQDGMAQSRGTVEIRSISRIYNGGMVSIVH